MSLSWDVHTTAYVLVHLGNIHYGYTRETLPVEVPQDLTILVMEALFGESLRKISHFKCVVDSLAVMVLKGEELGKEFGVKVM
jgi:hypothetical protein